MDKQNSWLSWAIELQSLAQAGLTYGHDPYDLERYKRIREISAEMVAHKSDIPAEKVKELFCNETGYQTPKVDTRAAIFNDGKILLVHESNGTWSLPGGWCEVTMSPAENAVKETKEEAGLDVAVKSVIAVQNRDFHNLPPYAYGVVKIFYLCDELGGEFAENSETVGIGCFDEDNLPPLAEEKCSEEQIRMCFRAYRDSAWKTIFD